MNTRLTTRIDNPNGDWPWIRYKKPIRGDRRKGNSAYVSWPHMAFNGVSVKLHQNENAILECIERNPDGVSNSFLIASIPQHTEGSIRAGLSRLRREMQAYFGQDFITGNLRANNTITFVRKSELKS